MKLNAYTIIVGLAVATLMCLALRTPSGTVQAQGTPGYGTFPSEFAWVSSTADQDILSAPGADMRWVVTGLGYNVLVEEADATVVVEDKAGTAVGVAEFAPETQGFGLYWDFKVGVECSQNSGVQVDLSGSTADVYIYVTAYKERVE